jgi:hypothetical protein
MFMKFTKLISGWLIVLATAGGVGGQTIPLYVNNDFIRGVPPQIDAAAFLNTGFMDLFIPAPALASADAQPFETLNTRSFTNRGIMLSTLGFRFRHATGSGAGPAQNFVNVGSIIGEDVAQSDTIGGFAIPNRGYARSWLFVESSNVVNSGMLSAGEGGLLKVEGRNLDLRRGGLRASFSQTRQLSTNLYEDRVFNTNAFYANPPGIFDNYWGMGTNGSFNGGGGLPLNISDFTSSGFMPPNMVFARPHEVRTNIFSSLDIGTVIPNLVFNPVFNEINNRYPYSAFAYTNMVGDSNAISIVTFVSTNINNGEVTANVRYTASNLPDVDRPVLFPVVEVTMRTFDPAIGDFVTNNLYLTDRLAALSNRTFSVNVFANSFIDLENNGWRPNNYRVSRTRNQYWSNSVPPNTQFRYDSHIFSFQEASTSVPYLYTAYSLFFNRQRVDIVTNLLQVLDPDRDDIVRNPYLPAALYEPTNQSGRASIISQGALDLRRTRLLAERFIEIKSPHIEYDQSTLLNAPFMSLRLGSTNGHLALDNLLPETVKRNQGFVRMHTSAWTNSLISFDSDGNSNSLNMERYVWIVDLENLFQTNVVSIYEGEFTADNILIDDVLRLTRSFVVDATNVTIGANGQILPRGQIMNINRGNFPRLVNFTNFGLISVTGRLAYGEAPGSKLQSWHNLGGDSIGSGHYIRAAEMQNSGLISSYLGASEIHVDKLNLRDGEIKSAADTKLTVGDLRLRGAVVRSGATVVQGQANIVLPGRLTLDISGNLDDGGLGANNRLFTFDGFELVRLPATGDFLNTRLESFAPRFAEVTCRWAGADRGASAAGFVNNAAVGRLVLTGGVMSRTVIEPVGQQNAIYVDFLEVSAPLAGDLANYLDIRPGMRIYYLQSNVLQETWAGIFGDRVQQVLAPVGAASTLVTLRNGQEFLVANWLLQSDTIDSDMDGIVNLHDENPFDDVKLTLTPASSGGLQISWKGAPGTEYTLQYRDELNVGEWTNLMTKLVGMYPLDLKYVDKVGVGKGRYYRVVYRPF